MKIYDSGGKLLVSMTFADLDDINNVNASSPSDNEALTWDAATSKWIAEAPVPAAHKTSHQNGGTDEISLAGLSGEPADVVNKSLFDAHTILAADSNNTPAAVALATSRLIGRKASGGIVALAKADILTIINVTEGADVTGSNAPQAHKDSHDPNDGGDALDTAAAGTIEPDDSAAVGTAHSFARSDHKHAIAAAAPVKVGSANAEGTSTSFARADHVHEREHGPVTTITFIIDGGGAAITTGEKGHLEIPLACTITQVTTLADQSGSIVVDIWKCTYAAFDPPTHPADGDSITASAPPTISSAKKAQDSTLTGWTTAIAAGDILAFNVDSITTCERVTISLRVTKT